MRCRFELKAHQIAIVNDVEIYGRVTDQFVLVAIGIVAPPFRSKFQAKWLLRVRYSSPLLSFTP